MKNNKKRIIDAKVWKTGNSFVVTVPQPLVERFSLKVGDILEIKITK